MRFLDLTLPSLHANLALDEALLLAAESIGHRSEQAEVLRIWEWPSYAVVLGAGCKLAEDVDEEACTGDGVPLARRSSGGGTVLLGSGCLLYSLVLCYERHAELGEVNRSYRHILAKMADGLAGWLPGAALAGTSDLACGSRKFSGNAQQRKRTHLLHHGTLLYDFDLHTVARYLKLPERQPSYREARGHAEFMMNLPADRRDLQLRLQQIWQADASATEWPQEATQKLVEEKYATEEWLRRR